MKISGSGFSANSSKIDLSIDGVGCDILSSTLSEVNCRLKPKQTSNSALLSTPNPSTQTKGFIGGAGFDYERYNISSLSTRDIATLKAALTSGSEITLL